MTTVVANARIARHAMLCGFADYSAMFSLRTWFTAYVGRMVTQVLFFGLIGLLIEDPATVRFLVIGNAVVLVAHETLNIIAQTTWERRAGTLPLLVSSPSNPLIVFLGRSLQLVCTGLGLAAITLPMAFLILGIDFAWTQVLAALPIVVLVGFSASTFGLLLGAWTFKVIGLRLVFTNVCILTFTAFCGVSVPLDFWPDAVQWIARFLPVTHGLGAIRHLLDGADAALVWRGAGLELAVALLWLLPSSLAIRILADGGRRTGTLEFGG